MQEQESSGQGSATHTLPPPPIVSTRRNIRGDLMGGFAAALVALPQALGKGALVFLPLGLAYVHIGIIAGLYAAIAGGLVAALVGRPRYQISGPLTSTAVICAALVATLAANPIFSTPTGLDVVTITTLFTRYSAAVRYQRISASAGRIRRHS